MVASGPRWRERSALAGALVCGNRWVDARGHPAAAMNGSRTLGSPDEHRTTVTARVQPSLGPDSGLNHWVDARRRPTTTVTPRCNRSKARILDPNSGLPLGGRRSRRVPYAPTPPEEPHGHHEDPSEGEARREGEQREVEQA